ncbi:hypothetical protein AAFF_G00360330 [Aldrovandia affinis]|uniref:Uncharacterized protein n=1 Tax=Aldrovandia affinis TaxID=143900 RepID=A0AAD7SJ99_9TELE|nr:hypothetical protein AAFF_G00360330 [Aldrovandia affinis]
MKGCSTASHSFQMAGGGGFLRDTMRRPGHAHVTHRDGGTGTPREAAGMAAVISNAAYESVGSMRFAALGGNALQAFDWPAFMASHQNAADCHNACSL